MVELLEFQGLGISRFFRQAAWKVYFRLRPKKSWSEAESRYNFRNLRSSIGVCTWECDGTKSDKSPTPTSLSSFSLVLCTTEVSLLWSLVAENSLIVKAEFMACLMLRVSSLWTGVRRAPSAPGAQCTEKNICVFRWLRIVSLYNIAVCWGIHLLLFICMKVPSKV